MAGHRFWVFVLAFPRVGIRSVRLTESLFLKFCWFAVKFIGLTGPLLEEGRHALIKVVWDQKVAHKTDVFKNNRAGFPAALIDT
jgi:hypothetical protein